LGGHLTRENVHYGKITSGVPPEHKDEAVKLVITTGRAVATVARELGINEPPLGRWVTAFKARNETRHVTPVDFEMQYSSQATEIQLAA